MKQRKIPDYRRPMWEASINGKKYSYPAGTTQMVPNGIADIIDQINAAMHPAANDDYVPSIPGVTDGDDGKVIKVNGNRYILAEDSDSELPAVTAADEGKVLKVNASGKWDVGSDSDNELPAVTAEDNGSVLRVVGGAFAADSNIFAANMTLGNSDGKTTITLNKTAEQLYDAVMAGKVLLMSGQIYDDENELTRNLETVIVPSAYKFAAVDNVPASYIFSIVNNEGDTFVAQGTGDSYVSFVQL